MHKHFCCYTNIHQIFIHLTFTVAPEITVSDQLHGVGLGANVTIKCKVEAHPSAINYWMKDQVCSKKSQLIIRNI